MPPAPPSSTAAAAAAVSASTAQGDPPPRPHREVLLPLSGLLMGMFVAILASTVVSTSLPRIISDLHGTQASYTWVVTATLLATTVSTPIWGKLADLMNRKLLVQLALGVFVLGTALAGISQDPGTLISFRAVQGLGAGGLSALVQIIMADIISPRERGKYMGWFGAVMAVGTVGGPLIGGVITDSIGWRANFYVALPFAVVAVLVLQRTLHLPPRVPRRVSIDYVGASLLAGGVSLLLIWVSLAGSEFDWASPTSFWMVGLSVVMLATLVGVERRVREPIIPMTLFNRRTFTLAVLASASVGVAMFGTTVFLSQYMQLARGATPTQSGLMTLPMIGALMISSTVVGALISRRGSWKPYMVTGSVLLTAGMALMSTIHYDTPFLLVSIYMFALGAGVGMVMQNLVLVVQNDVDPAEIGVASAGVSFFRSLGGAIGVSAMGAVLGSRVVSGMSDNAAALQSAIARSGAAGAEAAKALSSGTLPSVRTLPDPVAAVVESVYGSAVADIFLVAAPLGVLTILAIAFLPHKSLSRQTTSQRLAAPGDAADTAGDAADAPGDVADTPADTADAAGAPVGAQRIVLEKPAGGAEETEGAMVEVEENVVEVAEAMMAAAPIPKDAEVDAAARPTAHASTSAADRPGLP